MSYYQVQGPYSCYGQYNVHSCPSAGPILDLPAFRGGEKFAQFEFANILRIRLSKRREKSPNSNSKTDIRIHHSEFEFESNPVSKIREYSPEIRIRITIVHDVILVTKTPTRKTQFSRR
jgi:hypothetical protein